MKKDENIKELVRKHEKQVRELQSQLLLARETRSVNDADLAHDQNHRQPSSAGGSRKVSGAGLARMSTISLRRR